MKKLPIIIISILLVMAVAFFGLWQHEKQSQADILALCQSGGSFALTSFQEYQENGSEGAYWQAVSDFRVFEQAYYMLVEGTNKATNYSVCNEVYGFLVFNPERSQEHIEEIIDVMKILAKDATDENGFVKMSSLRNTLDPKLN